MIFLRCCSWVHFRRERYVLKFAIPYILTFAICNILAFVIRYVLKFAIHYVWIIIKT